MVGLKTFWILISTLFLLAACVPQTKQTECGTNEAFNASLRTCVPVVGGPSSFINIATYVPAFTQTRSKDDMTVMSFTISVSNPYSQSYSVEWERVFNAAPENMCSNSLTCSFPASLLGTTYGQVGTHILTAKVKDGNGTVVDTHSFEIKIDDLPKPVITYPVTPSTYAFEKIPTDPRVQFSFTIKNNGATIVASDNYKTEWTVQKDGSTLYSEYDVFTNLTTSGSNTAYLGTAPTPYFNPATLGVGTYVIRALVTNDVPGEIVAEQMWSVIVKQPDLANITTITNPAPGITINSHNNIDYNDYPTLSWIDSGTPNTSVAHSRFCVTVDDSDGTYPADGKSIQVRWYLDSLGGDICTKKTQDVPGTQTICLVDTNNCEGTGAPFDVSLLKFSNSASTVVENHKVTARLFDEATTYEFDRADVVPSNGSYPIEWKVLVKPVNLAPTFAFGSTNPSGCISSGAYSRSGCLVNQGTPFTVSFSVSDDFYNGGSNPGEFQWNVYLKHNSADLTTPDTTMNTSCSKAFNTSTTLPAASTSGYSTQWTCTLNVPHYNSSGPLDPSSGTFQVVLTAQDQGSPVGGAGLASQSLTWNLQVTESNPAAPGTILNPQVALVSDSHISKNGTPLDPSDSNSYATELETILFRLNVRDDELDNLKYRISLCTDNTATCATSVVLTSPAYVDFLRASQTPATTNPALITGLLYQLPEDLLIGRHSTTIDIDTATSRLVYFKVDVIDVPSVGTTTARSDSEVFRVYVRNLNPAPTINTATASPAVGSTTVVYAGFPLTIDPGSVIDSSTPASEKNIQYQWYAKTGVGSWTTINGATSRILRYTPGNITSTIDLKLCVGDGTAANQVSPTGTCSASWFITPKLYLQNLSATGSGSLQNEMAVWYDDTNSVTNTQVIYSAYVDENEDIFIEKTIKDTNGNLILSTSSVTLEAIPGNIVASTVSNLSIAGSTDSLYIAYIASPSTAPASMVPRIRRIDKNFDLNPPTQAKNNLSHPAPFGFNYAHYTLTASNVPAVDIFLGDGIGGAARVEFDTVLTTGDTITINGEIFTADPTPTGTNEICDSSACATVNSTATNLADKINNSTLPSLQGLTARVSAGTVEIYNQYHNDYLDFDGSISGIPGLIVASSGLGRIVVSGGRWHLPFINASLSGSEQNNVTVLSGSVDVHMRSVGLALNTNDVLTEMGKTALFDVKLNSNGELVFARISGDLTDAGAIALYRYTLTGSDWSIFDTTGGPATDQSSQSIFGTYSFEYVRLATNNLSNPYYYVIAKEKSVMGGEYHIGRYHYELDSAAAVSENFITTKIVTTDATDDTISNTLLKSPDVVSVPGFPEARIFFHSVGTGSVPYPRIARWKSDDSITCGPCFALNGSLEHQSTARVGISQVANDLTLGAAGASVSENVNDVVFALFSSDTTATDIFKPQLGIINIEAEAIQSTSVNGSGLFQPPFILDQ
jgi:hypothetical protein